MCLVLRTWRQKLPRISFKPIKVYKVLRFTKEGKYITPMQGTPVSLDKLLKPSYNLLRKKGYTSYIGGGYIHFCLRKEEAVLKREDIGVFLFSNNIQEDEIVECYIPPFTWYYKNKDEGAARKLYITNKIIT